MVETQDPYRRMIERPGFARTVNLVVSFVDLVRRQQYGPDVFRLPEEPEPSIVAVHGLAAVHTEVLVSRYDLPDNGRVNVSNPEPYFDTEPAQIELIRFKAVQFRPSDSERLDRLVA